MLDKIKQILLRRRDGHSVVISGTGIAMGTTKVSGMAAPTVAGDALRKGTRVTTAELPALTTDKIWKGTGADPTEIDVPAAGVTFTELAGGENKQATGAGAWEDWDISAIIGAGAVAALIQIRGSTTAGVNGCRKNGSALVRRPKQLNNATVCVLTECDASRIIEIYQANTARGAFDVLGYWS